MNWRRERPTSTGFWWLQASPELAPVIVYVDAYKDVKEQEGLRIHFTGFAETWGLDNLAGCNQWAGPLEAPTC